VVKAIKAIKAGRERGAGGRVRRVTAIHYKWADQCHPFGIGVNFDLDQ